MGMVSLKLAKSESNRLGLFKKLEADRVTDALLYAVQPGAMMEDTWLALTDPATSWLCDVQIDGQTAAAMWVNGFAGRSCFGHLAVLRHAARQAVSLGQYVAAWIFSEGMACIMGLTPAIYRHALKAAFGIGFEEKMRVPYGCYLAKYHRCVDGVVSILTPERLNEVRK